MMFEKHFEFEHTPFTRAIPTDKLYKNAEFCDLNARLKYTAERQLFSVVIGDAGTGKTTLLRNLRDELGNLNYSTLYVADSKLTPRTFYKAILEQLGFQAPYFAGDAKLMLHKQIEILKGVRGVLPVAIVDEAHLLSMEMLEEIRFLLNYKMDSENPLALILCGQTELWDKKLALQSYAAIRQRINWQCVVGHLDRSATEEYINAHLSFAGATRDIFTEGAVDAIYKFSGGIQRLINSACTNALFYAAQSHKQLIDDHMVKFVIDAELLGGAGGVAA